MQKRIYLASPYTHADSRVREARYLLACKSAAQILSYGYLVFSPIAHSHILAKDYGLSANFDFWQNWCLSFLRYWATHFCILDISGWRNSKGIAVEKVLAQELGLPVLMWTEMMGDFSE